MATSSDLTFTLELIRRLNEHTSRLKNAGNDLDKFLTEVQLIVDTPSEYTKLTNGLADLSDYTIGDLNSIKSDLETARDWVAANL
jgi:hypothetical protein